MQTTILNSQHQKPSQFLTSTLALLLGVALFSSCARNQSLQTNSGSSSSNSGQSLPSDGSTFSPDYSPEPLTWESSSHPERKAWSAALYDIVAEHFTDLNKATDANTFCPGYGSLSADEKINLWADIFAGTTYYESSYNPLSASVDVGTSSNKDTWSVGLLQMSVVDQKNYGLPLGYTYADLQDPIKNLELGVTIMALQVRKKGIILIPQGSSGTYWATLHPGGTYDKTAAIATMTKKLSFCH